MARYQVTSISRYDFVPEGKTQRLSGCKVNVLLPPVQEQNKRGSVVLTMVAPYQIFDSFQELPAAYDLETTMVPKGQSVEFHVQSVKKV